MINFFTLKPESFGLAIDDISVNIAYLKKKGRFLNLASWNRVPLKTGVVENGEINNKKALVKAIEKALNSQSGRKIKTNNIVASLPEQKAFLQIIQMPKMKFEELREAIRFEAENYIPLPIEEVYLDFQIVPPLRDHLDHCDVLIVALPQKTVDAYMDCFKDAGLSPLVLEVESQSIARALIQNQVSPFPVLLVDIGGANTGLTIFSGYSVRYTSSIPISSRQFTLAVVKSLKVDIKEAEKLKQKYGLISPAENKKKKGSTGKKENIQNEIFEAMASPLADLVEQIKRYLDFYHTHVKHEHLGRKSQRVERVFLSGGEANIRGFSEFLSSSLGIPVEVGNPWINILPEPLKEVPGLAFQESLAYTTVLGLALRSAKNKNL